MRYHVLDNEKPWETNTGAIYMYMYCLPSAM